MNKVIKKKVVSLCSSLFMVFAIAAAIAFSASNAQAAPTELPISWEEPSNSEGGLVRAIGDAGIWTFSVRLDSTPEAPIVLVGDPVWSYPGSGGADPDWGVWGPVGTSLTWSAPKTGGEFTVSVSGRIRKVHNGQGGGAGVVEEKDFNATWDGEMDGPCSVSLGHDPAKVKVHSAVMTWNKCKDVPADFGSYSLYGPSTTSGFTPGSGNLIFSTSDQNTESHLVEHLAASTTYYFILKVNHAGEVTTSSDSLKTPDLDVQIEVSRFGREEWDDAATVAAGGRDTNVHKGDIRVTVKDPDGALLENEHVVGSIYSGDSQASVTLDGYTNSAGIVLGNFKSGHTVDLHNPVTIQAVVGNPGSDTPKASFNQRWNDYALNGSIPSGEDAWTTSTYFIPGEDSPITYNMSLASLPITTHSLSLETTRISGMEWKPDRVVTIAGHTYTGEYVTAEYTKKYSPELQQPSGKYRNLTTYSGTTESTVGTTPAVPTGHYTTTLKATDYGIDFILDSVQYQAKDADVQREQKD